MADIEKVIKNGEQILTFAVDRNMIDSFVVDALKVIKEQKRLLEARDAEVAILARPIKGKWVEFPESLAYEGAYDDSFIVCSACNHAFNILDNCTEEFDYCPHCGADMRKDGDGE